MEKKIGILKDEIFRQLYPTGDLYRSHAERYAQIFEIATQHGLSDGEAKMFAEETNIHLTRVAAGAIPAADFMGVVPPGTSRHLSPDHYAVNPNHPKHAHWKSLKPS